MAAPFSGYATATGVGIESTYGTAVARETNWIRTASWSLARQRNRGIVPHLTHDDSGAVQEEYVMSETTAGTLSFPMRYVGVHLALLNAALGNNTDAGGGSPYTHTLSMDAVLPSLTLEGRRGNSTVSEVLEGCKVNTWGLKCAAGEVMMGEFGIIGQTGAARGASGTPAYGSGELIAFHHCGTIGWNSGTYTPQSFEVTGENKLSLVPEMGALFTAEPGIDGRREVRFKAVIPYRNDNLYVQHHSDAESDLTFTFTGATSPNAFAMTLKNARIWSISDPISSAGYVTQTVEWLGKGSAATGPFNIVVTNGAATHITG